MNPLKVAYALLRLPLDYFANPVLFNDRLNKIETKVGRTTLLSYPTYFGCNLSQRCNQSCNFCILDNERIKTTEFIDESIFKKMKWLRFVHNIDLFAGNGESLLNPRFPEIIKTIREVAPHSRLMTFTNGLALNGRNLDAVLLHSDKVHISLNAVTRETYDHLIQGGDFDLIMANLDALSERKPPGLTVELSMVFMRSTVLELRKMVKYAADHGFEVVTACHYILLTQKGHKLPESESMSHDPRVSAHIRSVAESADKLGVAFYFPQTLISPEKCYYPWRTAYITTDVEGLPLLHTCCSGMHMDTYLTQSTYIDFKKAWNSKRMQMMRRTVNLDDLDKLNNMCHLCKQLDRADRNWRIDLDKISETREGIYGEPHDIPHVFPKEVI